MRRDRSIANSTQLVMQRAATAMGRKDVRVSATQTDYGRSMVDQSQDSKRVSRMHRGGSTLGGTVSAGNRQTTETYLLRCHPPLGALPFDDVSRSLNSLSLPVGFQSGEMQGSRKWKPNFWSGAREAVRCSRPVVFSRSSKPLLRQYSEEVEQLTARSRTTKKQSRMTSLAGHSHRIY